MASLQKISEILYRLKQPACVTKIDWLDGRAATTEYMLLCRSDAYKHLEVRQEDRQLQVLSVGGRLFIEEKITFGCVSSPGLFERPSWFLLKAAIVLAGANKDNACKQVDDALVFGRLGDPTCQKVYDYYRQLAPEMGVKLAPESDPTKAFPPATSGVCLGVELDLVKWTWAIPMKKITVLRHDLHLLACEPRVENGMVERLAGRLNHYAVLVPEGPWERSFINHLHRSELPKTRKVLVTPQAREQAAWWLASLPAATEKSPILDLRPGCREGFDVNLYPDAAGGSGLTAAGSDSLNGAGGVCWETGNWYSTVWPHSIQCGVKNKLGVEFSSKLTTLEGVAALYLLVAEPLLVRMRPVCLWTDNLGLYYAYRSKSSKCCYAYTVARAIREVARGLDILLCVRKTPRCSGAPEECADALSKSDFTRFAEHCPHRREDMSRVSLVLSSWVEEPYPTNQLGRLLLLEIEETGVEVLWFDTKPKRKF